MRGTAVVALVAAGAVLDNEVWRGETTLWSDVVSESPGGSRDWNNLGQTQEQLGRFEAAEQAFSEAARLDPEYPRARANLGITLHRLGRIDEAPEAYGAALLLEPDIATTWSNRGSAALALPPWGAARAHYQDAPPLPPRPAVRVLPAPAPPRHAGANWYPLDQGHSS